VSAGFIAAGAAAFVGLVWLAQRHSILAAGAAVVILAVLIGCALA
jgi:hypothetical protein